MLHRRRVLDQHGVEGLPRAQGVHGHRRRRVDVPPLWGRLRGHTPHAEWGKPVLHLQGTGLVEVFGTVDRSASQYQRPWGWRPLDSLHPGRQLPLPPRADDGEVTRRRAGRALTDVAEVVRGEGGELEREVAITHVGVGQDDRLLAQVQPGQGVQRVRARAASPAIGRIHESAGVPELVDRGVRDHVGVLLVRHPVVPKLGVVDVREAVDECLNPRGVGILRAPVELLPSGGGCHRRPVDRGCLCHGAAPHVPCDQWTVAAPPR
jgi:hypothetical protein